jgi:hypothetical protein
MVEAEKNMCGMEWVETLLYGENGIYEQYNVPKEVIDKLYKIYSDIILFRYDHDGIATNLTPKEWDILKKDIEKVLSKVIVEKFNDNFLIVRIW